RPCTGAGRRSPETFGRRDRECARPRMSLWPEDHGLEASQPQSMRRLKRSGDEKQGQSYLALQAAQQVHGQTEYLTAGRVDVLPTRTLDVPSDRANACHLVRLPAVDGAPDQRCREPRWLASRFRVRPPWGTLAIGQRRHRGILRAAM